MPVTTRPVRGPKLRTFTLARLEQASSDQSGLCLNCGHSQDCCEPDARKYRCDACKLNFIYGTEEIVLMGLMR
jgi:hypothetical protein